MNNIRKLKDFLTLHWFGSSATLIVLFAAFLRFYKYGDRWGLAYDQAHDVILSEYAIVMHKLPLLGPYSSAGPFQTGGEWYWFIMLGRILFPHPIQGPWIFLTLVQVLFVGLMISIGCKLGGRGLGLLAGVLAAISPAGIAQAINLTNQSLLNIVSGLLILFSILYLQTKKNIYLFLMGIFTTVGATLHLQGVPLVFVSFLTLLLGRVKSKKGIGLFFLGAVLPIIPNIYADYFHKWVNTKNMLQYELHDQYKIPLESLGRRWSTYLDKDWPLLWANVISKNIVVGYGFIIAGGFLLFKDIFQKHFSKYWVIIIGAFLLSIYLLHNVRTPLFDSYIMFLHPSIFLISAAILRYFFRKNVFLGTLLLICVMGISLQKDFIDIKNALNWSSFRANGWTQVLIKKYPNEKFALYDYTFRSTTESAPLVMYLQYVNKVDNAGHKIGLGAPSKQESQYADYYQTKFIKENTYGFVLVDINSSSSASLAKEKWGPLNPSYLYNSQEE